LGDATTTLYDALNLATTVIDPRGDQTIMAYLCSGQPQVGHFFGGMEQNGVAGTILKMQTRDDRYKLIYSLLVGVRKVTGPLLMRDVGNSRWMEGWVLWATFQRVGQPHPIENDRFLAAWSSYVASSLRRIYTSDSALQSRFRLFHVAFLSLESWVSTLR
jgi:hypothetical protein